jgi:antitoxin component YwqK of YwqJK toxin-antitoxin module
MRLLLISLFLLFGLGMLNAQNEIDTLNQKDELQQKQGYWIITGKMRKDTSFAASAIIEQGKFKEGRKVEMWVRYYPNGNIQSKIFYIDGRPNGMYQLYYSNGEVEEVGNWSRNKNIGEFKRFYENGELMQHFQFGDNGRRNGKQFYYYPNGEVEVEVELIDGKEDGVLKRFYNNGELKSELNVKLGIADSSSYIEYKPKKEVEKIEDTPKVVKKVANIGKAKPNIGTVNPEGYNKLYTRSLLLKWDGTYHHGKPWNGKKYVYDSNGMLVRIEVYKNGLYIGNGVIEEE